MQRSIRLSVLPVIFSFLILSLLYFYISSNANAQVSYSPVINEASIKLSATQYGTLDYTTTLPLSPGATSSLHVWGVVSDQNGEADISLITVNVYRTSMGSGCTANDANCYVNSTSITCDLDATYGTADEVRFDCLIPINYWADATGAGATEYSTDTWSVYVKADDVGLLTDNYTIGAYEVDGLLSLEIPTTISFGQLSLGDSTLTANNVGTAIKQNGNIRADVTVSGTAMTCTSGTIPLANIQWSLTDVDYGSGTVLTATPVDTNLDVAIQTTPTQPSSNIHWNISIPATGVGGACTGSTTITAIAH